ncbi:MAG: hypothetical protein IPH88_01765 [Bacteroidales bacterium]|nr:hypothetical protein [Bacteroidales bacterium]
MFFQLLPSKASCWRNQFAWFFIKNTGQFDSRFNYCLKTASTSSYFAKGEVVHQFLLKGNTKSTEDPMRVSLDIEFLNYNPSALCKENDILPGKINFLIGRDSSKWKSNVTSFQTLVYENIYSSIDLVYHATNQFIENDFVVHPGGRIEDISLKYKGIDIIWVNKQGELVYKIDDFEFKEVIPEVFQIINGQRINVSAKFQVNKQGKFHIRSKGIIIITI